jgi:hypothetical protein
MQAMDTYVSPIFRAHHCAYVTSESHLSVDVHTDKFQINMSPQLLVVTVCQSSSFVRAS